jgi:hypothetical protein
MRFLFRMAFWLTVILILLPSGGSQQPASKVNLNASDAMSAAGATVTDMKQFCGRQSEACAIGSQVATALGQRAQAGAKMLYEFLNERLAASDTGASKSATGKTAAPSPTTRQSQHTLTPSDLAPAWRGPQPQADARRGGPA